MLPERVFPERHGAVRKHRFQPVRRAELGVWPLL
jgi:hypothetical protein